MFLLWEVPQTMQFVIMFDLKYQTRQETTNNHAGSQPKVVSTDGLTKKICAHADKYFFIIKFCNKAFYWSYISLCVDALAKTTVDKADIQQTS